MRAAAWAWHWPLDAGLRARPHRAQGRPVSYVFGRGYRPLANATALAPTLLGTGATVPLPSGPLQLSTA
jgi:hypothetical protein